MNKPEISILLPSIRPQMLGRCVESIIKATKRSWELIIVSPFPLPPELQNVPQIKYLKSFQSPCAAAQMASLLFEGKYLYPNYSDDAFFLPNSIDRNIDFLISLGDDYKNVVVCKYSEGANFSGGTPNYQPDSYYKFVNAYPVDRNIVPEDWWIFNGVFWHRKFFEELGGWDCSYDTLPLQHGLLSIRAYLSGANVKMSDYPICDLDWGQSDHGPIEDSQNLDTPRFIQDYQELFRKTKEELKIDRMNWKNAPSVWERRFSLK